MGVLSFVFLLLSAFFAGWLWFHARKNILIPIYVLPFWPDKCLDEKGVRLKYHSRRFFLLFICTLVGAFLVAYGARTLIDSYVERYGSQESEVYLHQWRKAC